jgi:uncharacterized protein (TIGR00369 family)
VQPGVGLEDGRRIGGAVAEPEYVGRVRRSFERQKVMALLGARLLTVQEGAVEIELPYRGDLVQQDGYLHAGVVTTVVDSAGGYAAYTLMPEGSSVLSVEFKVNFLAPARGDRFVGRGTVIKAGRTLTVCGLEVTAFDKGKATICAVGTQTLMCLRDTAPKGT